MTADVESEIAIALNTHLSALSVAWPKSFPNVGFMPPNDGNYLKVSFQPNETETYSHKDGPYRYLGLYQITITTKSGMGEIEAVRQASLVARHFEYLTQLTTPSGVVKVTSRPSVRPGIQGKNTYEIPVTIRYELIIN